MSSNPHGAIVDAATPMLFPFTAAPLMVSGVAVAHEMFVAGGGAHAGSTELPMLNRNDSPRAGDAVAVCPHAPGGLVVMFLVDTNPSVFAAVEFEKPQMNRECRV